MTPFFALTPLQKMTNASHCTIHKNKSTMGSKISHTSGTTHEPGKAHKADITINKTRKADIAINKTRKADIAINKTRKADNTMPIMPLHTDHIIPNIYAPSDRHFLSTLNISQVSATLDARRYTTDIMKEISNKQHQIRVTRLVHKSNTQSFTAYPWLTHLETEENITNTKLSKMPILSSLIAHNCCTKMTTCLQYLDLQCAVTFFALIDLLQSTIITTLTISEIIPIGVSALESIQQLAATTALLRNTCLTSLDIKKAQENVFGHIDSANQFNTCLRSIGMPVRDVQTFPINLFPAVSNCMHIACWPLSWPGVSFDAIHVGFHRNIPDGLLVSVPANTIYMLYIHGRQVDELAINPHVRAIHIYLINWGSNMSGLEYFVKKLPNTITLNVDCSSTWLPIFGLIECINHSALEHVALDFEEHSGEDLLDKYMHEFVMRCKLITLKITCGKHIFPDVDRVMLNKMINDPSLTYAISSPNHPPSLSEQHIITRQNRKLQATLSLAQLCLQYLSYS